MYIYKPVDTFQIWNWQCDSSFQVNKPVNCLSWCKARNHPMSLVVGTDTDVQIWELSESHVWEQRNILQDGNSVVRSVAWSSNIGKDYETIGRFLLRALSFPSLTYRTAASASSRSAPRGTLSRAVFAIMVGTCGGLSGTLQARSSLRAETMTVSACGSRRLMWGMDMGGEE